MLLYYRNKEIYLLFKKYLQKYTHSYLQIRTNKALQLIISTECKKMDICVLRCCSIDKKVTFYSKTIYKNFQEITA